jgi:DNA-binding transcriptional LysR family regulator
MDRLTVMQTFIRIVDAGSFSAAARQLNIGQPAVSKSIAQLEERLGVRLLMRSTQRLTPTEAGQSYYDYARRAVDAAEQADLVARGVGTQMAGRLRISVATTLATLHIIPRLPAFLDTHPDLSLELILDDRMIDLIEEGVDMGLRIGTPGESSLTARKLAACRRLVLGAPSYFQRRGTPSTPAELREHTIVVHAHQRSSELWTFRQGASETAIRISGRLCVSAGEGVRTAVLSGMGLTIMSEWMFTPELASGAICSVLTDWALPMAGLWAVFPTGHMISAKARAFAAFAESELRKSRPSPSTIIPNGNKAYEMSRPTAIHAVR